MSNEQGISIKVRTYSGSRADEDIMGFDIGSKTVRVVSTLDRWLGPEQRYFKVSDHTGAVYILRQDIENDRWELVFFESSESGHRKSGGL